MILLTNLCKDKVLNFIILCVVFIFTIQGLDASINMHFREKESMKICSYEFKEEHDYRKLNDCIDYYKKIPYSIYSDVWKAKRMSDNGYK